LVLLALAVRFAVVVADTPYQPANDAHEYDYLARSIAAGDGYPPSGYLLQGGPTAIRGPGYPYLLGGVYALSGNSRTAGRLAGALLGALSVLLLYLIAKRIWGRRVGIVAAAMAAVFPPLVLLSRDLLSESLFIPLELGALLCVLNFRRSGGALRWAAAAGALAGVAALTRNPGVVLLVAALLGVWIVRERFTARSLLAPALVLLCFALVLAPWITRNAAEFGKFIPLTTSTGITAAGVYNEASFDDTSSHGAWRDPQIVPQFTPLFTTAGIDEAEVDETLRSDAWGFARRHPSYVVETFGWNLIRMFEISGGSVVDDTGQVLYERGIGSSVPLAERIGLGLAGILAILGVTAIARSKPRDAGLPPRIPRGPLFFWSVPILILASTALLNGLPRDRLPVDPFLLILASIGLIWLWDRTARKGEDLQ
jgi:4-amino-4-deoxy-L-arabinose transferase-like glycosyltransferase